MEEKMRIIVSGMEPKAPYKHDVKKMNQIQRALENYLDDEYGYRKVFFIAAPTGAGKTTLMEQTVFVHQRMTKFCMSAAGLLLTFSSNAVF